MTIRVLYSHTSGRHSIMLISTASPEFCCVTAARKDVSSVEA
jgi:hypothetical protein